jgi:hypothetical protein
MQSRSGLYGNVLAPLILRGQFGNVLPPKAKEVQNVHEALSVKPGRCLELHFALRAPCYPEPGRMEHEEVVGAIAHCERLGNGDRVLGGEREEERTFLGCVDDGMYRNQFTGQCFCRFVHLQLSSERVSDGRAGAGGLGYAHD